MTAARDSQSVEARKARYSRELAAYTLRQWDLVRQSMEGGDNKDKSADSPSLIARQGNASDREHRPTPGVHAHDYARGPYRQNNHRAVAGNA
ncbi:hypothetical protein ONZ51_g503 [Trametes cubensis]|uniref:Uncharacterized protein n=1 Tax=Trametes cubensis TaxID=1111947 RepID=A0AAD7XDV0_9APHY|nr:hypothetical protein ONZ51_g503 [Trametes cubensis]